MFLLSIFIFREGAVRMFHPWTEKLPLSSLQRKRRKFDCNGKLEHFGCAGYWFLSCIYSILVLGNVKYLERDGKVDMLKTVWHDWVFIFVKVFSSSIKLFCFTFLALLHSILDLKFPDQEWNLCPLQWKLGVSTAEPSGKSQCTSFISSIYWFLFLVQPDNSCF